MNFTQKWNKTKDAVLAASVVAVTLPGVSHADAPDLSSLTTQIDFSTVITAVLAVGAAVAGVYIVIRGVKTVLPLLRG